MKTLTDFINEANESLVLEKMSSKIEWQYGTPRTGGRYLVTMQYPGHKPTVDTDFYYEDKKKWDKWNEEIIGWFPIWEIEPCKK